MKVIDILNKIAKNELQDGVRFEVYSNSENKPFVCEFDMSYPGTIWCIDEKNEIKFNYKIDYMRILNYEIKTIEENKEIKELWANTIGDSEQCRDKFALDNRDKINELVRAVNKLNKESEEK